MPTVNFFHEIISGYDISCHGGTASVSTSISGGSPPYTYKWYNTSNVQIATSKDLISAPAGVYTLYLYKNGNSSSWNVTLTEPNAISITLSPSVFAGGYNISQSGGSDGTINCIVQGGVPSYYFQWSNGSDMESVSNLNAGTYLVTITDENGCTGSASKTLTAPTPLVVSSASPKHNMYEVSCTGGSDGVINLTVSGGVSPYSYTWSDGVYTKDRSSLSAGSYTVLVDDANPGGRDTVHLTLNQPSAISIGLTSPILSSGFNTSCYSCKDGKITATVNGGLTPYSYHWNTGKTTLSLDSLGKGIDTLTVTDNNGCILKKSIEVTADIEGWKIGGNLGIDTSKQFMGTKDSIDLIVKTNGKKRMTVTADGVIEMNSPLKITHASDTSTSDYRVVYAHSDGTIDYVGTDQVFSDPCLSYPVNPWFYINSTCANHDPKDIFLPYYFRNVGIGIQTPLEKLHIVGNTRFSPSRTDLTNYLNIGNDGNSKINSYGSGKLLINYNSTQNVEICTGSTRGDVTMGGNTFLATLGGKVGIGNPPSYPGTYKLYVKGGILTEKLRVADPASSYWADYVFDKKYDLISLAELNTFILINKHLPGIPTSEEVQKDGVDIGEMQGKLLQKIEELTLYLIKQQKEIDQLNEAFINASSKK